MPASDTIVEWRCYACNERGRFANLPDTTLKQIRDAVTRGHSRRSTDQDANKKTCHDKRGITKVKMIVRGKTLSFSMIEAMIAGNGVVEAPRSHDQSSGNTTALAETPAPSTAK